MADQIVEPELQDALERAKETANKIIESAANPSESIKEIQHIGSELSEMYKQVDWLRLNTNLFNPTCYQGLLEELVELQKKTIATMVKNQEQMIQDATQGSKTFFAAKSDLSKPQSSMAQMINQSLDNYDKFATNFRDQAAAMGKMQTSYFDWCKKTLTELSKPHAQ